MTKEVSKTKTQVSTTGVKGLSEFLNSEAIKKKFTDVLGKKGVGFISSVLSVVASDKALANADRNSIYNAALLAASLDLPINQNLGLAYIIGYNTKQADGSYKQVAQFQLGYRGLKQLALRTGQFVIMNDEPVKEGELVEHNRMTGEIKFNWIQDSEERLTKKTIGYLSYFRLVNGFESTLYMTVAEVDAHAKKYSQNYKKWGTGLWKDEFDLMALKGLDINTDIITKNGFKKMGEIVVGDTVFDIDGNETSVIAVSERKFLDCYKITFSNGESVVCDEEHDWVVRINTDTKMIDYKLHPRICTKNIKELYEIKQDEKNQITISTTGVDFPEKELPIDPYLLGYWIGNGSRSAASLCSGQQDVEFLIKKIEEAGFCATTTPDKRSKSVQINISRKDKSVRTGSFLEKLRENNLIKNKHIPEVYKLGSKKQRLELLQGLFDADGTCGNNKRSRAVVGQVRKNIIDDVYVILCSLGETPNSFVFERTGYGKTVTYYEIQVKPNNNLFQLPRKADLFKERKVGNYWAIKSIEKVDTTETVCIAVDSPTKTFLATKSFIPTHNTVTKMNLSKNAPLSVEMQRAVVSDQAVIKNDNFINEDTIDVETQYVDNEPEQQDHEAISEHKAKQRVLKHIEESVSISQLEQVKNELLDDELIDAYNERIKFIKSNKKTSKKDDKKDLFDEKNKI